MRREILRWIFAWLFICAVGAPVRSAAQAAVQQAQVASAQNPSSPQAGSNSAPPDPGVTSPKPASQPGKSPICSLTHLDRCVVDVAHDQAGIWTSPLRFQPHDTVWFVPFAAATGVALVYDKQALQALGSSQHQINISNKVSDLGSGYTLVGEGAGMYVIGSLTHNDHLTETGRLGLEAIVDASIVGEGLKLATNRQRPDTGKDSGEFWPHGTQSYSLNTSFPSGHAIATWAFARVVASEYPNKLLDLGIYTVAAAVSVSRVTGRHHFPSDVIVGSTFGYLVGGYVVGHHSSRYKQQAFSLLPIVDQRTHSYALTFRWATR
jgi:membrane-associated phospholipid phosphatase